MKKMTAILVVLVAMLSLAGALAAQSSNSSHMNDAITPVEGLIPAKSPLYPVGTAVIIKTDHMEGMQGAAGVVSGVYETILYAVDYMSEDGKMVINHRWVIAEEIQNSTGKTLTIGDTVSLGTGHMGGHGGVGRNATIVQISRGPAYMVDYDPVGGGERVVNHQWVSEYEIEPVDAT